jgi:3-carboxy-cis,cis-muconate cycloisomerase
MALAPHVGRPEAQRMVKILCERAVKLGVHLRQVVIEEESVLHIITLEEVDQALDAGAYLGSTNVFIDRALASYHEIQQSRSGV